MRSLCKLGGFVLGRGTLRGSATNPPILHYNLQIDSARLLLSKYSHSNLSKATPVDGTTKINILIAFLECDFLLNILQGRKKKKKYAPHCEIL